MVIFKGDLGSYLQKKGRLSPSKALRFAVDIARHVRCIFQPLFKWPYGPIVIDILTCRMFKLLKFVVPSNASAVLQLVYHMIHILTFLLLIVVNYQGHELSSRM